MPSYPDSVKSFTAKSAGQNIDPAHVNDLQDEVNAIEAGLRNGTAPLNSSGSTMTRLQVTGGSTFTIRPVTPPPEVALVYLESTYAAASSAASTVAWNAQAILTNSSMHSTGTNPERLTPQTTGVYQVAGQLDMTVQTSASYKLLTIRDSSVALIAEGSGSSGISGVPTRINVTGYKRFDVLGGYCTLNFATEASTHSFSSGAGVTWFSLVKL